MKVSVSVSPEFRTSPHFRTSRAIPWVLAAVYLAAHLPFLAPTLEDVDSINFGLGLREFNPALHQPHPPGYPIYIALGRIVLALVDAVRPGLGDIASEALALSLLSALAGAAAIVLAWRLFEEIGRAGRESRDSTPAATGVVLWSTLLIACNPVFWISGARPMSDMLGLAAAFGAQLLLLQAPVPGALAAGLALGIRSQTALLTVPLLLYVFWRHPVGERARLAVRGGAACVAGVVAWAIPLVIASGGVSAYTAALTSQADEDLTFIDLLWTNPTPRRLAFVLFRTFALPWSSMPLAAIVLVAAAAGVVLFLMRDRRTALLLGVMFLPYLVFHVLFQETITIRYALPVVPLMAFAAARSLAATGRFQTLLAIPIVVVALLVGTPTLVAYGREGHPAFRALDDIARRAEKNPPTFLVSHVELRKAVVAARLRDVPFRIADRLSGSFEPAKYWASGGRGAVWFLADPRRTDLELIDPRGRADVVRYRWSVADRPELGGTRPIGADWYRLPAPGWFLSEGWSLTPETGGVASATGKGPHVSPIVGYARRRSAPMQLMIGGWHLGQASDGPADFELALDGRPIDRWTLTFEDRSFLRFVDLPEGVPPGPDDYARITVASRPAAGSSSRSVPVAVRQFDIQPQSDLMYGFGRGWHEAEYVFETGTRWRWTSERAVLEVRGPAQPVRITLKGESPLRYFAAPPVVTVTAAGQVLGRLEPEADFTWSVVVPAEALRAAQGEIAIETSRVFVPAQTEGSADTRHLGLRIFECVVQPAR